MKFVVAKQEFNELINMALNVVSQKPPIPILSNFLIEANQEGVTLTATDLTVGIRCFAKAKVLEEGALTLPARRLALLTRELTADNLEIWSEDGERVQIRAGSSLFKLHSVNNGEYPSLPELTGATKFTISEDKLKDLLLRTSFAVSKDDERYVLMGVSMQISKGKVTFIGTDGKRLSKSHAEVEVDPAFSGNFIIPLKAVDEIAKNLSNCDDAVVYLMNDKIAVETGQSIVITKLLVGDYPDVSQVIPENSEFVVSLHREELTALLRQIGLFASEATHSVRFSFCSGELKLDGNAVDVGEGKVSMPVNYDGPQFDIAFNPGFFLDVLRHTKGETVTLGLTDPFNPGLITDSDVSTSIASSPESLFVLMPMRLEQK